MNYLLTLILIININLLSGQDFKFPIIKTNGNNMNDFIPKGWNLVDTVSGDLNKDNYNDIVFIINNRVNEESIQHYILIIAFHDSTNNEFKLIEQCNNLITSHQNEPGPWYEDMEINKGIFEISFFKGGSTDNVTNYKFRFQENDFYLIGADRNIYNPSNQDFQYYSFNFLSKKWSISTGNDESDEKPIKEWKKLGTNSLMKLKNYKGPFTWEVAKGIYL